MGEAIITITTFLIGVPLSILDINRGKMLWGFIGMVLCLLPLPLSWALVNILSSLKGFAIEP